jgi:deoxyadenosine/deoxycytidine kinase
MTLLPESPQAIQYLPDLQHDRRRWAFETQLAFLSHKATRIASLLDEGRGLIVDRTLDEDANIFARYFYDAGDINPRAYETYQRLAGHFLSTLPPPDLIIYCYCDALVAHHRIIKRGRPDSFLHSIEHLRSIQQRYERWIGDIRTSTVYRADSERFDWTKPAVAETIARDIDLIAQLRESEPHRQLDFFEAKREPAPRQPSILEPIFETPSSAARYPTAQPDDGPVVPYPSVYIAAPFTAIAGLPSASSDERELFSTRAQHGRIPKGQYRRVLTHLATTLSRLGFHTLLPHRDVNKWGRRSLRPDDVMRLCTHHVQTSDLFVGILGMSHGSHYEFGLARGLGKPCIVLRVPAISESFMAQGLSSSSESDNILIITADSLRDLPNIFLQERVRSFIRRHFGMVTE